MSGNNRHRYVKRQGDWSCNKCNNSNYASRNQCYRCKAARSGNRNEEGGLGVGTALLVGAGAAAVGFLAQGLWNAFQGPSSSSSPDPPAPPPGAGSDDIAERKRQRDAFRGLDVPEEMMCAVCLVNPREVCMLPCGHVYLCEDCAEDVKSKCPMCREPIESKKAIYL